MKEKHVLALAAALAVLALAPVASAQGMILDPDGAPSAWASFVGWFESLFAGPAQDPAG